MQCKCRVVQILNKSEMCDKFGLKTKKLPGLTDYRLYFIHKLLNMLLSLQGKSGTELGGLLSLAILTDPC